MKRSQYFFVEKCMSLEVGSVTLSYQLRNFQFFITFINTKITISSKLPNNSMSIVSNNLKIFASKT